MSRIDPSVETGDEPFGLPVPTDIALRAQGAGPAAHPAGTHGASEPETGRIDAEITVNAPARRPRFCASCGAAWQPDWDVCQPCAVRATADWTRVEQIRQEGQRDQRSVVSAIALYFALLLVSAVTIVIVMVRARDLTAGEDLAVSAVFAIVTMLFALGHRPALAGYLRTIGHPRWYAIGLGMAVPTFVVAQVVISILVRAFGIETLQYSDTFLDNGWGWGWLVLTICVMPGIFEEIAFRGVILSALDRVLRPAEAIAVSAFAFAILHLSIPSMPHLLLIGVTLGLLRHWSGSLYPGMLMHFTHNLLVVLSERWEVSGPWS